MASNKEYSHPHLRLLFCGLLSGVIQAGTFNFWDRALFLAVKENRPFLRMENFRSPMHGVFQSLSQKAVSGGLYFPLEQLFSSWIEKNVSNGNFPIVISPLKSFIAGNLAGGMNGLVMNPLSAIKVC